MKEMRPNPKAVAKMIQTTPAVLHTLLDGVDDALLSWRPMRGNGVLKKSLDI